MSTFKANETHYFVGINGSVTPVTIVTEKTISDRRYEYVEVFHPVYNHNVHVDCADLYLMESSALERVKLNKALHDLRISDITEYCTSDLFEK